MNATAFFPLKLMTSFWFWTFKHWLAFTTLTAADTSNVFPSKLLGNGFGERATELPSASRFSAAYFNSAAVDAEVGQKKQPAMAKTQLDQIH